MNCPGDDALPCRVWPEHEVRAWHLRFVVDYVLYEINGKKA